ncbi:GNAT family N-acetyltransferase [Nocardia sp. NPDC051756]|uniref:GNAT family N-acetyltransferase n=1 Tax=Nocardia sp. NPDC051756 TaxID=3154751 RepID=UPI0034331766
MSTDPVLIKAQALWEGLAAVPVSFTSATDLSVVVSPKALICPQGWAGIIVLHGRVIVTAPNSVVAALIRAAAAPLSAADLVDPDVLRSVLPLADVLGPAVLAYVDEDGFRPAPPSSLSVEPLPAEHLDLRKLALRSGDQDTAESGLNEITSPAFAVRDGGELIAAAGYRTWPSRTAHLSVLTAPDRRGRGLARIVASAAVAHALDAGLLPQWRARPPQSRRVALALGFRELGTQLSIRLS